jgi:hypothetical protein
VIDVPDVGGNVVVGGVDERLVQVHQQHQLPALDQSTKHILLSLIIQHYLQTTDPDSIRIRILLFLLNYGYGSGISSDPDPIILLKFFLSKFAYCLPSAQSVRIKGKKFRKIIKIFRLYESRDPDP